MTRDGDLREDADRIVEILERLIDAKILDKISDNEAWERRWGPRKPNTYDHAKDLSNEFFQLIKRSKQRG